MIPELSLVFSAIAVSAVAPAAGLVAVVMALPTTLVLNPMPRGSFSLLELAILTSTIGIGVHFLLVSLRSGWKHLGDLFVPAQIVIPIVLLLAAAGLALMNLADPPDHTEAVREVRTVIIEPLLFFVTAGLVMRRPVYRAWAGIAFVLTAGAIAIYGVAQIALDIGDVQAADMTRATALYSHHSNLAIYLERTLLFTFGIGMVRPRWYPMWILAFIQFAGLLATYSWGALLGVLVGVAVAIVFIGAWRWRMGLMTAGILGGMIGFLLFPDRLLDVGGAGIEPTRFTLWRSAVEMIKAHPVLGVGPDQFLYQYLLRFVEPMGWPGQYASHPYNIVLDTWLRLGTLGLATLVTVIVGVIWLIQRNSIAMRRDPWATGAIAALFGGFIHSMVDNGFFLPDLAVVSLFFIIVLVTVPAVQTHQAEQKNQPSIPSPDPASSWPTWQRQGG